jgi:hypothetical protein
VTGPALAVKSQKVVHPSGSLAGVWRLQPNPVSGDQPSETSQLAPVADALLNAEVYFAAATLAQVVPKATEATIAGQLGPRADNFSLDRKVETFR